MGDTDNWRMETNAEDFFGGQKKRMNIDSRRMVIRKPSDLVGPGIAATAIRVMDFNDLLATYNGYYSAAAGGADNAPTSLASLVGFVISDAELGGVQVLTRLDTGVTYQRTFTRAPYAPEAITWGTWAIVY